MSCLLALALCGCHAFGPPRAATLARLRPMPIGGSLPNRFEVELSTPSLSGVFDAVLLVEAHGLHLQLFPDIGGKVLDLRLREASLVADMPGHHYEAQAPLDRAPPHLALGLAAVFAELIAPVVPQRVLGERLAADGRTELSLQPALGSGDVVATLGPDGAVELYAIRLGWLEIRCLDTGELRSSRFAGWLRLPSRPAAAAAGR